jgi:hypothetical protein
MSLINKEKVLFVSRLANIILCEYLLYKFLKNEWLERITPEKILGQDMHMLLNYDQQILYTVEYNGYIIEGKPDRVYQVNSKWYVDELKVSNVHKNYKYLHLSALLQAQLYLYLLDRNNFDVEGCRIIILRDKFKPKVCYHKYNRRFVEAMLNRAISFLEHRRSPMVSKTKYVCNHCDAVFCEYRIIG